MPRPSTDLISALRVRMPLIEDAASDTISHRLRRRADALALRREARANGRSVLAEAMALRDAAAKRSSAPGVDERLPIDQARSIDQIADSLKLWLSQIEADAMRSLEASLPQHALGLLYDEAEERGVDPLRAAVEIISQHPLNPETQRTQ